MSTELNNQIGKTGYTLAKLREMISTDQQEYSRAHRNARRLDALDRGKLWEALKAKFPRYQLLPQTNHVSYVKNNILASIYTVGKSATFMCTSEQDRDIVENLNVAIDHIWDARDVAYYELAAGERAALLNLGVTQVGWDNSICSGKDRTFEKGQVSLKNIDPLKYYRDPFAQTLDDANHVVVWEDFSEEVLSQFYGSVFDKWKSQHDKGHTTPGFNVPRMEFMTDKITHNVFTKPGYHRVYTWFLRQGNDIHEVHIMDMELVLLVKEKIKPAMFPFAELYCNMPSGDLVGTSEPAKIMDNSIVYNIMQSIIATSEYKNQNPPRFITNTSGINVNAFVKHGNEADRTFVVQGDATKAVHYHQYPQPSQAAYAMLGQMTNDIQTVSGVDGKYTGRDTGSVITTGGVNSMLDAATMIDTTKIQMYEFYAKRLSKLIIYNYIAFGGKRKYIVKDSSKVDKYSMVDVDFAKISPDIVMDYTINISSELPKNKARLAAVADAMIEKQMQYQGAGLEVDLITPQEWLMMQDIPNKEYFEERMGIQRTQNWNTLVAQAVTQYAGLVDQGVAPANAIGMVANQMAGQQSPEAQAPTPEDVVQSGNIF